MRQLGYTLIVSIFAILVACGGGPNPEVEATSATEPPVSETAAGAADELVVPGARFDQPAGWVFREPSSSMRLAEAEIPGDEGAALLTAFFFGPGGGGGTDANLQRWAGQIEAEAGAVPTRDSFEINGYTVSTIAVEGTLRPSRMGSGPTEAIPGSKLVGAVVEGPGGPWFFKVTGPAATVVAAEPAFDAMLRSVSP
ncbi:MAG: hypothetical protein V2I67_15380 [Thermoanaerobaculales bacterium]|jgi:hypothetical protein|nr:hypothetical protein [Thermoanaerobaculales bacterium]